MINFLRVLIWTAIATCACLILAANVYQINVSVAQKQNELKLINSAQETLLLQAKHVARMEETLINYTVNLAQMQQQIQLLEKSLETSILQVQGLVDDNSKLEAELDSTSTLLKATVDELERTKEKLVDKIKELEEAQNHG